jgi:hypothetical protein
VQSELVVPASYFQFEKRSAGHRAFGCQSDGVCCCFAAAAAARGVEGEGTELTEEGGGSGWSVTRKAMNMGNKMSSTTAATSMTLKKA